MRPWLAALLLLTACLHKPWVQAAAGQRTVGIQPGEGVGNVDLGMRAGQVHRRLGEPGAEDRFDGGEVYWTYPWLGLSVRLLDGHAASFFCYSGLHGGWESRDYQPFPGTTPAGVGVQSDRAEILAAYGPPTSFEPADGAPIPAYWMTYPEGLGFCLTQRGDRVVYLSLDR